jgi:3-oxoacyl-[acyl-carrier-protein] synthase II
MTLQTRMAAITGTGVVTALSSDVTHLLPLLNNKQTAVGNLTRFPDGPRRMQRGAELNDGDLTTAAARWAQQACHDALQQAGWQPGKYPGKMALVLGTTAGEAERTKYAFQSLVESPDDSSALRHLLWYRLDTLTSMLGDSFQLSGPRITFSNACATGPFAVDYAIDLLDSGEAQAVLVCCMDMLSAFNQSALSSLHILARDVLRAFDAQRTGTLLGDGAGALVLERVDSERRQPVGYIQSVAVSCDAYDLAGHRPDGLGMAYTMMQALDYAKLSPQDIAYINTHGTGTRKNDREELEAINTVFAGTSSSLVIGSTKAATGHASAASGIIELIISLAASTQGIAPPTLFHTQLDTDVTARGTISSESIPLHSDLVMSNSFSFGGGNGTVIVSPRRPALEYSSPSAYHRRVVISSSGFSTSTEGFFANLRQALPAFSQIDTPPYQPKHRLPGADDFSLLALAASAQALSRSHLDKGDYSSRQTGIVFGTCYGSAATNQQIYEAIAAGKYAQITPFMSVNSGFEVACDALAVEFGAQAFYLTVTAGELASLYALAIAAERVRHQRAEMVLSVGSEILLPSLLRAVQQHRGYPLTTPVPSAGSICHVVESLENVLARKATPLFEVCSWKFLTLPADSDNTTIFASLWQFLQMTDHFQGETRLIVSSDNAPLSQTRSFQEALRKISQETQADWLDLGQSDEYGGLAGALAVLRAHQELAAQDASLLICCRDLFNGLGLVLLRSWSGDILHDNCI